MPGKTDSKPVDDAPKKGPGGPGRGPKSSTRKARGLGKKLKTSAALQTLFGTKEKLSRAEILKLLWKHIKDNDLQNPDKKSFIRPDTKMIPIFGKEEFPFMGMIKYTNKHLTDE